MTADKSPTGGSTTAPNSCCSKHIHFTGRYSLGQYDSFSLLLQLLPTYFFLFKGRVSNPEAKRKTFRGNAHKAVSQRANPGSAASPGSCTTTGRWTSPAGCGYTFLCEPLLTRTNSSWYSLLLFLITSLPKNMIFHLDLCQCPCQTFLGAPGWWECLDVWSSLSLGWRDSKTARMGSTSHNRVGCTRVPEKH